MAIHSKCFFFSFFNLKGEDIFHLLVEDRSGVVAVYDALQELKGVQGSWCKVSQLRDVITCGSCLLRREQQLLFVCLFVVFKKMNWKDEHTRNCGVNSPNKEADKMGVHTPEQSRPWP